MSTLTKPIHDYDSVRIWLAGYAEYWGGTEVEPEALEALGQFCQMLDHDPDNIIGECLRPEPSGEGLMLRTRARRRYIERIAEFEAQEGSRQKGNAVRSFFIHNGVAMNPSILK